MSLSQMRSHLWRAVRATSTDRVFASARERHAALAPYPSLSAVLAELGSSVSESFATRDALTRVLVAEAQRWRARLCDPWAAALVLAYLPMLIRLRARLRSAAVPAPDLDQLVAESFLDVVRSLPLARRRDRIPMHLRQGTQRRVFLALKREERARRERQQIFAIGLRTGQSPFAEVRSGEEPNDAESRELEALLAAHLHASGDLDHFELVRRTALSGQSLRAFARSLGASAAEQETLYNRLKRRRERVLRRLEQ
ncbi:MAG: hypothetical protein K8H88_17125, partial [Sandaracinaceae bacterium]|nr:hypothetical protein [Sandaracinaceae bacterium]